MKNSLSHKITRTSINRQKGTVLITVLLVVSFVVILVANVNKTVNYQASLNRNLMNRDQAYSYLIGMEELAKIYLKKAFDSEKDDVVHLEQPWAQEDITFPFDGGGMTATITDMQSCLNLNSIGILDTTNEQNNREGAGREDSLESANNASVRVPSRPVNSSQHKVTTGEDILTTLIEKVIDDSETKPSALAAALRDWIDTDTTPSGPDGVEDIYYQGLDVPYLPPNGPIAHVSELRTIKSFSKKTYAKLRKYLCVLPSGEDNKLNINTITNEKAELLYAALGGKVDQSTVNELISERPEAGYDMQTFWEKAGTDASKVNKKLKERLDITSRYFQMEAKAEINTTRVYMKTLFLKEDDNHFKVVSRYFGKE